MASRTPSRFQWLIEAIHRDLVLLHTRWMGLIFPQQDVSDGFGLKRWVPTSTSGWVIYQVWSVLGTPALIVAYPLALLGLIVRYYAWRIGRIAFDLGVIGASLVSAAGWGILLAMAHLYGIPFEGIVSVAIASVVAISSAVFAMGFARVDGRWTTVLISYPFAVTALFLPPVVTALYSPTVAEVVFPMSIRVANWILDNILTVGGFNAILVEQFNLVGIAYIGMWVAISVPIGWLLGLLVTLADLTRPRTEAPAKSE